MTAAPAHPLHALVHLHPDRRKPALAAGTAMMVLGLAAPLFPAETSVLVGAAAGWLLWLAGALMLGFSLVMLTAWLRLSGALVALAAVAMGAYLTLNPAVGAAATAVLLAAALVMDGSFQLALALRLRPLAVWRWMLASAFASLVAAGLLGAGLPARSPEAIAWLLSIAFLSTGAALVALSFARPAPGR